MIQRVEELKDHIQYGSSGIDYYIKRSKRVKTSELIVDSDRIEVRTPMNKTLEDTRDMVRNKAQWILRKQKEYRDSVQEIIKPTFQANSTLPYLGQNYHLAIYENQWGDTMEFLNGVFVMRITGSGKGKDVKLKARELYEEWLKRTSYHILKQKTEMFAEKVGVKIRKISVKSNLKSRWASLTRQDSINFNMHLIKAPQHIIDYIVLHEVCHFRIKGHSHHYWNLIYRYMPDYQEKIYWLNVNGKSLTECET